jgi:hypothetical protein
MEGIVMKETLVKAIAVAQEELEAIKEYHDDVVLEKSDYILSQVIKYLKDRLAGEVLSDQFSCYSSSGPRLSLKCSNIRLVIGDCEPHNGMLYTFEVLYADSSRGYNAQRIMQIKFFYDLNDKAWRDQTSANEIMKLLVSHGLSIADAIIGSWKAFKERLEPSIKADYEKRIQKIKDKADEYASDLDKLDSFKI